MCEKQPGNIGQENTFPEGSQEILWSLIPVSHWIRRNKKKKIMEVGHLLSELYLIIFHPKDFRFVYLPCMFVSRKKNGEILLLASSQKSQKVVTGNSQYASTTETCHEGQKVFR